MKGERDNSVETRLGARLTYANQYEKDKSVQPFVEANWLHNNAKNQIDFNTLYTFKDDTPDNRYEVKVGVEGQMSANWAVWGHVAHQMGSNDYSGNRAVVGVKYQWK
ncbi:Outer membrane protein IcsA autotransporter precursor [Budvicia aquatica]|uniref:Outer membrane protein IcsA autotransporter n=1 Tax=Budvicia aquatica TaxID=82979 RepID=A0A484ZA37_9GAMM|nr:Outer membrane protein IcsA autotransporter precursor [Budvicia aquatica]